MKKDLTKGSISKNIILLALPMMAAFLLHTGFNIVDTIFLGRLSALALAAISITFPVIFLIIALASGVGIGVSSLIARLIGAKKEKEANNVAEHALLLAVILGLFFTIFGLTLSKPLFILIGATPEMMPLVLDYVYVLFSGSFFMFFAFIGNSILRGEGDTKTPMKIMMLATVINIALDPLLIFGIGFFPRMEMAGAALATVIARSISAVAVLVYLFKGNAQIKLNLRRFKFKLSIIKEILSVGIPASLSQAVMSLGMFFMMKIVSQFGPFAIAAYGLAGKLDMVALLPGIGLSTAVITIVGQNIGAKKHDRAIKSTWTAVLISMVFMEVIGLLFLFFPEFWIGIFNKEPQIISYGVSYIKIISPFYMLIGVSMIISASFQGAGKGNPSLLLSILRLFILSVPLAYFLSRIFGVNGIWLGISLSTIITAVVAAVWFKLWEKS
ncbi:MAG: MATE family efflux transporter [Nanoarchaeota archaeon]